MADDSLTPDEQTKLIELLQKLEPGFYPIEIFWELARLVTLSIIEFVPLRMRDGAVQVLLTPRGEHDKLWPNGVHIPGCVVRPTDSFQDVESRIMNEELGGVSATKPMYLHTEMRRSKRGAEQAQVFWIEVANEPTVGDFVSIDNLPENLVEDQHKLIYAAAEAFQSLSS